MGIGTSVNATSVDGSGSSSNVTNLRGSLGGVVGSITDTTNDQSTS